MAELAGSYTPSQAYLILIPRAIMKAAVLLTSVLLLSACRDSAPGVNAGSASGDEQGTSVDAELDESVSPNLSLEIDTVIVRSIPFTADGQMASVRYAVSGISSRGPTFWHITAVSGADTLYERTHSTAEFDDYFAEDLKPQCDNPIDCKRWFILEFVTAPQVSKYEVGTEGRTEIERRWTIVASEYFEERGMHANTAATEAKEVIDAYRNEPVVLISFPDHPVVGAPLMVYDTKRRQLVPVYNG